MAPSGKAYTINGYVNNRNQVERVETWLGENIMGDMHILATYSGWKDFGGAMAPAKIVQTRGGWPFFEVDVTAASANPADLATLAPAPPRGGGPGVAPVVERPVVAPRLAAAALRLQRVLHRQPVPRLAQVAAARVVPEPRLLSP